MADSLELSRRVSRAGLEAHAAAAVRERGRVQDVDVEGVVHPDPGPGAKPAPRADHGLPRVVAQGSHEKDLSLTPFRSRAQEARGEHAASVRHHEVARLQQIGEVAEDVVAQRSLPAIEDEQARGIAFGEGLLGDRLGGERVVEVGRLQNSFFWGEATGGTRPKCS